MTYGTVIYLSRWSFGRCFRILKTEEEEEIYNWFKSVKNAGKGFSAALVFAFAAHVSNWFHRSGDLVGFFEISLAAIDSVAIIIAGSVQHASHGLSPFLHQWRDTLRNGGKRPY